MRAPTPRSAAIACAVALVALGCGRRPAAPVVSPSAAPTDAAGQAGTAIATAASSPAATSTDAAPVVPGAPLPGAATVDGLSAFGGLGEQLRSLAEQPPTVGLRAALGSDPRRGAQALAACLAAPAPGLRLGAARLLGAVAIGEPRLIAAWSGGLERDHDPDVRVALATAAIGRTLPPLCQALAAAAQRDVDGRVRAAAGWALGTCAKGDAVSAALAAAARDAAPAVRLAAVSSLRRVGDRGQIALVRALAGDADPRVRGMARRTLRAWDALPAAGEPPVNPVTP